ncbi:MAG: NosD domain-containing protein [Candidatus Thermoplasmatota archaeon]
MKAGLKSCIFVLTAVLLVSNFSAAAQAFSGSVESSPDSIDMPEESASTAEEVEIPDKSGPDHESISQNIEVLRKQYEAIKERAEEVRESKEYYFDQDESSEQRDLVIPEDREKRDPIRIESNEEFSEKAENNNWSGDGSEDDPYTIEGYEINGNETGYGIYIRNVTDHFVVKDCSIYNATNASGVNLDPNENSGIYLQNTWNGHLENNTVFRNHQGIYLVSSSGNTISKNNASNNAATGINLSESYDNTLEDNIVGWNEIGIQIWQSINNEIVENIVKGNEARGISLDTQLLSFPGAINNQVIGNEISGDGSGLNLDIDYGIYIGAFSNENLIRSNDISGYFFGIYVGLPLNQIDLPTPSPSGLFPISPQDNTITDNVIQSGQNLLNFNPYSIGLFFTENNLIDNNTMQNGGIMILGLILSHWNTHTITEENTVNDRPVRYWKDREGGVVPEGSGQVLLGNCSDVVIEEHELTEASVGIQLGFSDENIIRNNTLAGGVQAMGVQSSSNNLIYRNEYEENFVGLVMLLSTENEIYHNNFLENMLTNAMDLGMNQWDNGYPSGGNYWSDHEGSDEYHGPEQNTSGSDGIIDEPYGENFTDEYPLKEPVPTPHVRIEHPLDGSAVSEKDVTARWTGIYRFTDYLEYEIRLDSGNWIDMGEEKNYDFMGLEEGPHDLYVRVADEEGNTFTNRASFIVDVTCPDVHITAPEEDKIFETENVTVEWEGIDEGSGIDFYELILDGELEYQGSKERYNLTGVEDGNHEIEIRAVDRAGNEDIDDLSFSVDTTPPNIQIVSPEEGEKIGNESVIVEWEASDPIAGVNSFEIRIEEEDWRDVGSSLNYEFTGLEDREYTVEVRALDEVGNSGIDEVSFTVNTVPPVVDILQPSERELIGEESITILWEGEGEGTEIEYYEVRIDEGPWIEVGMDTSYTFDNIEDGEHTVGVQATNGLGNAAIDRTTLKVDTTPPEVGITTPEEDEVRHTSDVDIRWDGSDEIGGIDHYEVRLEGDDWIDVGGSESYVFSDLQDGEYTAEVRAWDNAGNARTESVSFLIDLPEEYTITVGPVRDVKGEFIDDLTVTLLVDGEEKLTFGGENGRYNFTVELISPPDEVEFEYKIEHEELEEDKTGSFYGKNSGEVIIDMHGADPSALLFAIAVGTITAIILGAIVVKKRGNSSSKERKNLVKLKKRDR